MVLGANSVAVVILLPLSLSLGLVHFPSLTSLIFSLFHRVVCSGWPSFRDDEVNWKHVRVLPNGETVSVDGTHLGHNLPDRTGSRYCINLVSIAGRPRAKVSEL